MWLSHRVTGSLRVTVEIPIGDATQLDVLSFETERNLFSSVVFRAGRREARSRVQRNLRQRQNELQLEPNLQNITFRTRQRREKRTDVVFDVTAFERTELECPECEEPFSILVASHTTEPSFGECSTWDCDAFHKYRVQ